MREPRYTLLLLVLLSLLTGGISQAMMLTAAPQKPAAQASHQTHPAAPAYRR